MYYKPDPKSAYPSIQHITNDIWARLARARHAPLGRLGLHHPHVHAHGARVPLRRVQVPARAELDHRRAAARDGPRRRLHRLPAAVGPDGVLGDDRRHQHQRHGADPRAVPRAVPARWDGDQRRHALALLRDPHAADPGRDLRADRAAHVSRRAARRHFAAVVEGSGRHRPDREGARERRPPLRADALQRGEAASRCRATASSSVAASSSSTRRTSRSAGSRSSRTPCGTTRSCRSSSSW